MGERTGENGHQKWAKIERERKNDRIGKDRGIRTSGTPLARNFSISAICVEVKRVGDVEARVMMRKEKSKTETRDGMVRRAIMSLLENRERS